MSLTRDIIDGFKSFFADSNVIDVDDNIELPGELAESIKSINARVIRYEKAVENGVEIHASDRIITAPNIPIIGSIVGWLKMNRINGLLNKAKAEKMKAEEVISLNQDDTVKNATTTNPFTNPNGKNVVKTTPAIKGDTSNPRELGGEIRTRKGR